jgi:nickel/cobalt exporter
MKVWRPIIALALVAICCATASAQGYHHPFAVGANEGAAVPQSGFAAWLVEQESHFYLLLSGAMRLVRTGGGLWTLLGLSFAYGVFHAAGPGHGKAVVSSYVVSNERALRRGLVISFLAALLQALVAIALVSAAAFVFHATAARITSAAHILEVGSYLGIIALGLVLLWRKGRALLAIVRFVPAAQMEVATPGYGGMRLKPAAVRARFAADDCTVDHEHGLACGHFHAPDPRTLGAGFSWGAAAVTVLTAGARPCSGAILVLVFALAQGVFAAGIAAALAMGLGTALTTGALAIVAVVFKDVALRVFGRGSGRALIVGRLIEVGAALCVIVFGVLLMMATLSGVDSGA